MRRHRGAQREKSSWKTTGKTGRIGKEMRKSNVDEGKLELIRKLEDDQEAWASLSQWLAPHFNIFDVLGISRMEIRHSNVLAWLMNPAGTHKLGSVFWEKMIDRIQVRNREKDYGFLSDFLLWKDKVVVNREYSSSSTDSKYKIDILLTCRENVLVIENKVGAGERKDQLKDYVAIVNANFPSKKKAFLFLTPDGELPTDPEDWELWGTVSYEDVLSVLDQLLAGQVHVETGPDFLIADYQKTLRRHVVKNWELLKACKKVYQKHTKAFDLVQKTISEEQTQIRDKGRSIIKRAIQAFSESPKFKSSDVYLCHASHVEGTNNDYPSFHSKRMDKILRPLDTPTGSWDNCSNYFYWFGEWPKKEKSLRVGYRLHLEFGGKGLTSDSPQIRNMQEMYKKKTGKDFALQGKGSRYHQTWKFPSKRKFDVNSKEDAKALAEWAQEAIYQAMAMEKDLIEQCVGHDGHGISAQ